MIHVGLIGDFDAQKAAHVAIPKALELASRDLGVQSDHDWIPTPCLETDVEQTLSKFHVLWAVPGSPYASMQGALNGIQFAREQRVPFLGTCGGFQHMIIEFARHVLGLRDADHAEINPAAPELLVTPLTCTVSEQHHTFRLAPDSRVAGAYGAIAIVEQYGICNYGLNPDYAVLFEQAGLHVVGVDTDGDTRIMELAQHPFFVGTLFQPERSAFRNIVHPLIRALVEQGQVMAIASC